MRLVPTEKSTAKPQPLLLLCGTTLLVTLAACSVGPKVIPLVPQDGGVAPVAAFSPPEMTAAEIAADATARTASITEAAVEVDLWWKQFHDPVLDALIVKADLLNSSIAESLSRIRMKQASLGVSESELWPTISGGAGYARVQQNFSQLGALGVDIEPYDSWSYGLNMPSWEIDLWGRIAKTIEASTADLEASVDDLRGAMVSVRAQVATSYIQVRTLQSRLDALNATIANLTQTLSLTQQKFDAGTTTMLSVSQAGTNLDLKSAQVPSLRDSLAKTIGQLAVLCGTSTTEVTAILGSAAPIPIGPASVSVGIPASLLARRPDLRSAEMSYESAVAQIGAAEAMNYPALSLNGSFSISATEFSGLGDISNKAYSFGPSLSLPLFTGWRISAEIVGAKARAELAFNAWRGTLIRAISEVDSSIAAVAFAREADTRYQKAVTSAKDTTRLATMQYQAGTTTLENLLDVQNNLLGAQDSQAQAQGLAAQSIVELYKSLGGGWSDVVPTRDNKKTDAKDAIASSPAHAASLSPIAKAALESKE